MRQKDIKIGGRYWTRVSGERIEVEVVSEAIDYYSGRTKYVVRRVDTKQLLPKKRSPAALHRSGDAYWPSMTEKQD